MSSRTTRRTLYIGMLVASAASFVWVCVHLSAHRMMWDDEFDAWNLLTDPSWRHAFQSLSNGADSGPPLYYGLGRCILAVTGLHPLAMRLYSAVCLWLAAVVWAQILRRYFGGILAVAAVVLAFLCNADVMDQIAQIRFYGELMLATALAVRIVLWLEQRKPSAGVWFAASALGGLLLVASHPLGLIYSAAIVFAQLCTRSPIRNRAAALGGTVLSWVYLVIFFLPVKHAAETDTWLSKPNAAAVIHYYNNHPLLFIHFRYVSVVLNLLLICLAAYALVWFIQSRKRTGDQPTDFVLLIYIATLLTLTPIGFGIVSNLYKPLFVGRYLLPYSLGLVTLAAAGAWRLTQRFAVRHSLPFAAALAIPLAIFAFLSLKQQYADPVSSLESLLQLARPLPVVEQADVYVRQAHYYAPSRAGNLYYILFPLRPGQHSTLHSIAQQGYEPEVVYDQPFLQQHREFLFVDDPLGQAFLNQDLRGNPHWRAEDAGTVNIKGTISPVIRFTRID